MGARCAMVRTELGITPSGPFEELHMRAQLGLHLGFAKRLEQGP